MKEIGPYGHKFRFIFLLMMINLVACAMLDRNRLFPSEPSPIPITPSDKQVVVIVDIAPLRLLPDGDSKQIGFLVRGSGVRVVGISSDGNWYLVKVTGSQDEAWIAAEFVAANIPQATTASPVSAIAPLSTLTVALTGTTPEVVITIVNSSASPTRQHISTLTFTPLPTVTLTTTGTPPDTATSTITFTPLPTVTPTTTGSATMAFTPLPTVTVTPTGTPPDTATSTITFTPLPTVTPTTTGTGQPLGP